MHTPRNAAISWHFERDPISYALETDWPVGAAGFEPLHSGIEIRQDSQPGAAGLETLHQESCAIAPAVIVRRK